MDFPKAIVPPQEVGDPAPGRPIPVKFSACLGRDDGGSGGIVLDEVSLDSSSISIPSFVSCEPGGKVVPLRNASSPPPSSLNGFASSHPFPCSLPSNDPVALHLALPLVEDYTDSFRFGLFAADLEIRETLVVPGVPSSVIGAGLSSSVIGTALSPGSPVRSSQLIKPAGEIEVSHLVPPQFDIRDPCFPPLPISAGVSNFQIPSRPSPIADVKAASPISWASKVKEIPDVMDLKYIKPVISDIEGNVRIKLPAAVARKGASIWHNTIVGFFLDKLPFSLVQACAQRHWGKSGLIDVLCNGNGFFFFKFSDPVSVSDTLEGGPWYFGGRPIFLKRWSPCMNLSKEGCKKVPIWAHFYNVPLEYWTEEGLSYIASMVGKPLHADKMTSSLRRLSYARICIEIDIDASLPKAFDLELEDGSISGIQIEYNWVPRRCSVCKEFGHLPSNCKKVSHQVWIPKASHLNSNSVSVGDWQLVDNHRRDVSNLHSSPPKAPSPSSRVQAGPRSMAAPRKLSPVRELRSNDNSFAALRSIVVRVADDPLAGSVDPLAGSDDPNGSGLGDPIPFDDPFSPAVGDPITFDDPLGEGVCDPTAVDDPIGTGACDPVVFDDPNASIVPMASCSAFPVGDSSLSALSPPINGNEVSSPSSSSSSTPLLARRLNMIDEVEMKLGRKKKDKKKTGCSGNSRGKSSKSSK